MKGQAFPCGKCLPCLVNRGRIWTHRIILESQLHSDNTFATLTYNDENLPMVGSERLSSAGSLPTLNPIDLQLFLKRLRKKIEPLKIRFFAVGEYGDETERPHYHAAIFGYPSCRLAETQYRNGVIRCCAQCQLVHEVWGKGRIQLGTLEPDSAKYISGYVTKKMTHRQDLRLNGRHPEFARMSNRPGIGHDFMHEVASTFLQFNLENREADVPVSLAHGKDQLPLGRYLRKKLRNMIGKDEKAPETVLQAIKDEMRPLQEIQFLTPGRTSLKKIYEEVNLGRKINFHARQKLKGKRKGSI